MFLLRLIMVVVLVVALRRAVVVVPLVAAVVAKAAAAKALRQLCRRTVFRCSAVQGSVDARHRTA